MDNNLDTFFANIRSSVESHAQRKGYTDDGPDGVNKLADAMKSLGVHEAHCIGEICYKCAEYRKAPRKVLMEKVAGWAWLLWKESQE